MRKSIIIAACVLMVTPALGKDFGQQVGHRSGHQVGQRVGHRYDPAPFIAGAIGLSILGAIIASRPRDCWQEIIGYDRYGRRIYETVCN